MKRIQKVSHLLVCIFNGLLITLPFLLWGIWSGMTHIISAGDSTNGWWIVGEFFPLSVNTPEGVQHLSDIHWTFFTKLIGFSGEIITLIPILLGLLTLRTIFKNYQKGNIFTSLNARSFRFLGLLYFMDALIIKPSSNMLLILSATLSNPVGHRYVTITFGSPSLEECFMGLLVMVTAWIMLEASKLQEDNELTI